MNRQAHGFQLRIMAALTLLLLAAGAKAQSTHIDLQGTEAPSVIDGVDVFSGKLEQVLPLLKVHGRGEISGGLYLPLRNPQWHVKQIASSTTNDKEYTYYSPDQGNPVTNFARAGYTTLGKLEVETKFGSFYLFETPAVTEIRFISSSGSIIHFRDTLTNGEPYESRNRGCVVGYYHPNPEPACSRGRVFRAIDGSNAIFVADADVYDQIYTDFMGGASPYQLQPNISGNIYLSDGTRVRIESALNTIARITDRNGNYMTFEYVTEPVYTLGYLKKITDSLNREITLSYGDATQPTYFDDIIYKGFGAAERRIRINYTKVENAMLPGQSLGVLLFPGVHARCHYLSSGEPCDWTVAGGGAGGFATSTVVPSSVVLANGQDYRFYYNNYLELARIKSPLGSYTDYSYSGMIGASDDGYTEPGCGSCGGGEIYRRISTVKNFDDTGQLISEKSFSNIPQFVSTTHPSYPLLDNITIDSKDGSGTVLSRSKYYYYDVEASRAWTVFLPASYGKQYKTESIDPVSQAVLRRTETTWQQREPFQWCTGSFWSVYICADPNSVSINNVAPAVDPRIVETKVTLETGQVTRKTFTYDQYNNVIDVFDYDFGPGSPGSLLRRTHTEYLTDGYYTSAAPNLLRLPTRTSVYDAGGIERARATYEYDNYSSDANHAALTYRPGISGLDAISTPSYLTRGNRTGATQYLLTNGSVDGSVSTYAQYDVAGNVVKVIDGRGFSNTFEFTDHFGVPNGNAHSNSSPGPLSSVGQISYAFATSSTNSAGNTSFIKFDYYTGTAVDSEDIKGIISSAYSINDPLDRVTKTVHAVNTAAQSQVTVNYDDIARTKTTFSDLTTNGDGGLLTKTFSDSFGREIETRQYEDGSHYIVELQQFDALGRVYRKSNPYRPWLSEAPVWTQFTYDPIGRLLTATTPDTAVTSSAYSGDQVLVTDATGRQRLSRTNPLKQVKDVWEITPADSETESISFPGHPEVTAGYHTSYAYDVLDQLITVTQGAQSRSFVYDSLKRLVAETIPERGNVAYQYDQMGNLLVMSDARGVSMHLSYDSLNRPIRRWYNSSSLLTSVEHNNPALPSDTGASNEVRFFYDAQNLPAGAPSFVRGPSTGQLVAATYGPGSSGDYFGYDAGGAAILKIQQTGGINYQVTIAHNASGRITSKTYPSGHTVSYGYDAAGRTNSFAGNLGDGNQRNYSTAISYSSHGSIAQEQFGTATPIFNKLFYNIRGQLAEIREGLTPNDTSWERGAIINFYSGCWGMCNEQPMPDNNGTLKRQEHWVQDGNGNVLSVNAQAYEYDSLNRIKRVSEGGLWQQKFTYDRYGNRNVDATNTTASLTPTPFEVQTSTNRLLAPGDTNLAEPSRRMRYDAAGNLTFDNYTGQGQRTYDAENHMTQAVGNGQWQTYTYDAGGQRVRRNVNGNETWQVYGLDGELVAEYSMNTQATTPQKEYGYRNGQLLVVAGTGTTTAPAPSALTAAPSSGGGNVILSWSAAAGAVNYRVERKGAGGSFTLAGTTSSTGLTDTGVSAGSAYLFRVCAANAQGNCTSPFSNIALGAAVSFPTDPTIISSADDPTGVSVTKVKAAHITELRTAVNAVRTLAGLSAAQWTNQTLTATVSLINADDVRDLRTKLNEALTALGIQTSNYDDQTLNGAPNGTLIRKVHITQLRLRTTSGIGGPGGSSSTAFSVQWLVKDQLGTPRMVFDETGTLASVKRHDYLPFGEELLAGARATTPGYGVADGLRQKFTEKERDTETGLDFSGARYYSSVQGRFTSVDPLTSSASVVEPQSWNRYSYCLNNPLVFVDPTGLEPDYFWITDGEGNYRALTKTQWEAFLQNAFSGENSKWYPVPPGTVIPASSTQAFLSGSSPEFIAENSRFIGYAVKINTETGHLEYANDQLYDGFNQEMSRYVEAHEKIMTIEWTIMTFFVLPAGELGSITSLGLETEEGSLVTVTHFTNEAGKQLITESGTVGTKSIHPYVTLPSQVPSGANAGEIEQLLEIGAGKGQYSITFTTRSSNLMTPAEGAFTSGKAIQYQLVRPVPINPNHFVRTAAGLLGP